MASATPQDITYEDEIVSPGNGAAQPEVRVRFWYDKNSQPMTYYDVFVAGWMLKDGRYFTREGAMARAEREVELARTQRRGHHW